MRKNYFHRVPISWCIAERLRRMLNNGQYPLIDWPQWWRGERHHFLEGMPFVGPHCKIIKLARECLKLRNETVFESAWADKGYSIAQCYFVSKKVFTIVKEFICWPNFYFLPGDCTAILFGVIPGVWFDSEDPVEEIKNEFHLSGMKNGDSQYYDVVLHGRFMECMTLLTQSL